MNQDYKSKINSIVDPAAMLPNLSNDKIWMLLGEVDDIMDDFERELAISYISCNHSETKHLCQTILRGKHDDQIIESLEFVKTCMEDELKSRKKKDSK